ncbi:MAG TPA: sporulation protein [Firmicutes bacterium]|nr:sporulation protein [Bacillota bacterium]
MTKTYLSLTAVLLAVFFFAGQALAATAIPRWPEPAWFAQFASRPPVQEEKPAEKPEEAAAQAELTAAEQHVYTAINQERIKRGLAPLAIHPELTRLARLKSKDMAENNYFAHRSPTYGSAYDMMRREDIRYSYAGENLAKTTSAANAISLFLNSGAHRSTLLNPKFNRTGVGIYQLGRQVYVTQLFIGSR